MARDLGSSVRCLSDGQSGYALRRFDFTTEEDQALVAFHSHSGWCVPGPELRDWITAHYRDLPYTIYGTITAHYGLTGCSIYVDETHDEGRLAVEFKLRFC